MVSRDSLNRTWIRNNRIQSCLLANLTVHCRKTFSTTTNTTENIQTQLSTTQQQEILTKLQVKPDETLLYYSTKPGTINLLLFAGILPGVLGAFEWWANSIGAAYTIPAWQIAIGFGATTTIYAMTWRAMRGEVSSLILTADRAHVRLRPFNIWGKPSTNEVTVPVRLLRRKETPASKQHKHLYLVTLNGDNSTGKQGNRHHVAFDLRNNDLWIPDRNLFDAAIEGNVTTFRSQQRNAVNDQNVYWQTAKDEHGRTYWWHQVSRETRWNPPPGWNRKESNSESTK